MAARNYRVRVVRGELQFEAEGDRSFVLAMVKRFDDGLAEPGGNQTVGKALASVGTEVVASSKSISIGEFIRNFGIKRHTDLVLAFGYYLEKHSGVSSFTAADISRCYYDAKMDTSNVSQSIIQNIKRGLIMHAKGTKGELKSKRSFTLTASGERHIEKFSKSKVSDDN